MSSLRALATTKAQGEGLVRFRRARMRSLPLTKGPGEVMCQKVNLKELPALRGAFALGIIDFFQC